ncbi:hypothetical protein NLM59_01880 [Weeksellaceae bacterium KMM 9724]|uniref:hypothetical protein n=1 Tax=Profundicola chukchiensis TaxID=2961959 RepID=UPI002440631E|nr:hypothetical protein [Profundicola chukchiensis]MDG4949661.1 hypothetical protein [Profundicola chukchiensis]
MKSLLTYYILILAPLAVLFALKASELLGGSLFVTLLLAYALLYRTYTDGKRLADKNIIPYKDIWKIIIPGRRVKYFRDLYLK